MHMEGAMVSWLVRSTLDRAIWVQALASDIVLCSWARILHSHSTSLHPGVQMCTGKFSAGCTCNPVMD